MVFDFKVYILFLLSGSSLSLKSFVELEKYGKVDISINDIIILDISDFKESDKITILLSFESKSSTYNNRDFYINYCETSDISLINNCEYIKVSQSKHEFYDNDIDYDIDVDLDYDNDYGYYNYKNNHSKYASFFGYSYDFSNKYYYDIKLKYDYNNLIFFFENDYGYEDMFEVKVEHYKKNIVVLIIVCVIIGLIALCACALAIIICKEKCR